MIGIYIIDAHGYNTFCPVVSVFNSLLREKLISEEEYTEFVERLIKLDEEEDD